MRRLTISCGLAFGVSFAALVSAASAETPRHHHHHKPPSDLRDARIDALESEVQDLVGEVRSLKAQQAAQAAAPPIAYAPPPPAASPAPLGATGSVGAQGGGVVAANNPPASSPDNSRPNGASGGVAAAAVASIAAGKPAISSPDGRFTANLHGVMQLDAANYFQDGARSPTVDLRRGASAGDTSHARDLSNGADLRRARIGIDGKVYGDFEYNVLLDFGGAGVEDAGHVQELWIQYSGLKPFHLRVGAFRPSLGLEDQGSTNGQPFLERPDSTDVNASLTGGDYREGAELWLATDRFYASTAVTTRTVGVANSAANGTAPAYDQALGFNGRLAVIPFKNDDVLTHIGVHGSYGVSIADAGGPDVAVGTARYPVTLQERPELRVDGTRLVSTGGIDASHASTVGGEGAAQFRNVFIQGEYEYYAIDRRNSLLSDPDFHGYYVEGGWVITGERRKYNMSTFAFDAPPIDHPFDLHNHTWGAWELSARYSDLDLNYHQGAFGLAIPLDGVRGGEQQIYSTSLSWYVNPIVRFLLEYQHVDVDRLSPSGATFVTPTGAQIGQSYDTLAIRSQLAF